VVILLNLLVLRIIASIYVMRFSIQEAVGDESSQYMASASATNAIHTTVGDDSWSLVAFLQN